MGLEVWRLARNSSDWHRLLETCALTGTLLLDEDGLYDPSHFNDWLIGNDAHLLFIPFFKLHSVAWIEPFSVVGCVANLRPRGDRAEWRLQCESME